MNIIQKYKTSIEIIIKQNKSCSFFKQYQTSKFSVQSEDLKTSNVLEASEANFQERTFVDKFRLKVQAGNGGHGAISFYRDRRVVSGAPDGGDGGKGGDVIFKATDFFKDFRIFKKKEIKGNNGRNGTRTGNDGKRGKDIEISVPQGTLLYEVLEEKKVPQEQGSIINNFDQEVKLPPKKKREFHQRFLIDLDEIGQEYVVCKGGSGGFGNKKHRSVLPNSDLNKGKPGQVKQIFLELKSIADVGLVGFPNVGKSTFLSAVTRSLPKIANYPFTTLSPSVGKIKFIDNFEYTIADIPGIIEESHKNKGLGLEFLRHIERTNVLLFVLDGSSDISLEKQLEILRRELLFYKPDFLEKQACVVCSKIDLADEEQVEKSLKNLQSQTEYKCFQISGKHGVGLGDVVVHLRELVEKTKVIKQEKLEAHQDEYSQYYKQFW